MTRPKTIAFRPTGIDQSLIDALLETSDYKDTTALMRAAIQQLAMTKLDSEVYVNKVADGYESEVMM